MFVQNAEGYLHHAWSVLAALETADSLARGVVKRGSCGIVGGNVEVVLWETSTLAHGTLVEFAIDANAVYSELMRRYHDLVEYSAAHRAWLSDKADYEWRLREAERNPSIDAGDPPTRPSPPFVGALP